jgi:steroid 5-alpha reductase family enzyme
VIHEWWVLLLVGWGALAVTMGALWAYATRRRDATIVDAGWGYGIALTATLYAILADGDPVHRAAIGLLAGVTGLKLGSYVLVLRVIRGREEDGRYRTLRARWARRRPPRVNRRFFVFFQAQGLLDVALSIPFLAAALNGSGGIEALEIAGIALWGAATTGETAADRRLTAFRAAPANRGKVCREGLWRYSRHPNYFFQILTWVSFALVACAAPWGWTGFLAPVLMTISIVFVTGIPPTEAQALESRGEAYREYQRTTSALVPWFPRRRTATSPQV